LHLGVDKDQFGFILKSAYFGDQIGQAALAIRDVGEDLGAAEGDRSRINTRRNLLKDASVRLVPGS